MSGEKKIPHCYECKQIVTFDNEHIGRNGRKIPLDPDTHEPHKCKEKPKDYGEFTPKQEEIAEDGGPVVAEAQKEKAAKVPRHVTAMVKILEAEMAKDVEKLYKDYVNKYMSFGGVTKGIQFYKDPEYYTFVVHYEIPNLAVAEMESG